MPHVCDSCGAHGGGSVADGRWRCAICGASRPFRAAPLRIVTGAAGTGKSSVALALQQESGLTSVDIDALPARPVRAADESEYLSLWSQLLALGSEIQQGGIDVVWCGICLPEQIESQRPEVLARYSSVRMLVLSTADEVLATRLAGRRYEADPAPVERHRAINARLRAAMSSSSIRVAHLDSGADDIRDLATKAVHWAREDPDSNPQLSSES